MEGKTDKYAIVGSGVPRIDGPAKVTGAATYCADISLRGMLHAKVLRSPHPHAKIIHVDATKAKKLFGVRGVITGEDTLKIKYGGAFVQDQYPLAVDKVRYIGDEIAAVAADTEDIAEEALDLIDVDYEILPSVTDPFEAMEPRAPSIHDHVENNISYAAVFQWGQAVEELVNQCNVVLEDKFKTHSQIHSYLEPHCSVASWDQNNNVTLWSTTQGPFYLKIDLASTLGIPEHKLRVIKPALGGAFGGKRDALGSFYAVLLSKLTGKPVKIEYTREEEYTATRHRHPMNITLKVGARKDGRLIFFDCQNVVDNGAYNSRGPAITFYAGQSLASLYRVQGVRYDCKLVYTNTSIGGPFRGYGNLQMRFALESMVDMIAEETGVDPVDIRVLNAIQSGDTTLDKKRVTSCGLSECIQNVAEASGWRQKRKRSVKRLRGVGLACYDYVSGFRAFFPHDSSSAIVKMNDDGSVNLFTGAADIGQGSDTILCQIVAETLGIEMTEIKIFTADTELTPLDLGAYASRTSFIAGNAVKIAATEARNILSEVIAEELEANYEDIRFQDGRVFVAGSPQKGFSFPEAVKLALNKKGLIVIGRGSYDPPTEFINLKTGEGNISPAYSYGAQIAEIEVDPETGSVKLLKVYSSSDCGFALNPLAIKGQNDGSIVCAQGMTLFERPYFNDGKILNPSFLDYHIPTSMEVPEIDSILVETMDPEGPFGAKGVSEGFQVPTAPAVVNAVYNATGIRIKEIPIKPEEILKGLGKLQSGDQA